MPTQSSQTSPTRALQRHASFEQLKKRAKALYKSLASSTESVERVALFFDKPEQASLQQVQLVVAREYGFDSWTKLKEQVPIAAVLAEASEKKLADSILKTHSPEAIEQLLKKAVQETLGWGSLAVFRFELSVGAAFGLSNDKGERCLLKVLSPDDFGAEIRRDFQSWLGQQGFPCPKVLVPLVYIDGLPIVIEEYVDEGRRADGHLSEDRNLIAGKLSQLIKLSRSFPRMREMPTDTLVEVAGSVWPKPHNVYFDFDATTMGAEWIDAAGARSKPVLDAMAEGGIIAHLDWSPKHFLIKDGEVSVIYDWDSVARVPETRAVGAAAAAHVNSEYINKSNRPTLEQVELFLSDYERHRGSAFSGCDLKEVWASLVYGAAYGARCEHAIDHANPGNDARMFLRTLVDAGYLLGSDLPV